MAANHMERMKQWIDTFADDVATLQKIVTNEKVPREARVMAAGALGYLVTRMDLIPDWEETCGIIDDAMIMRVAIALASEKDIGDIDGDTMREVGRLANEAEVVHEFLGEDLYPRIKKYTQDLTHTVTRGRLPETVVDDAKARRDLWAEIKDELKALPPAPMTDPDAVARTVRNYLSQKLK
jgi:uncharacterized membrane protein YkvA (DUF1232 family)